MAAPSQLLADGAADSSAAMEDVSTSSSTPSAPASATTTLHPLASSPTSDPSSLASPSAPPPPPLFSPPLPPPASAASDEVLSLLSACSSAFDEVYASIMHSDSTASSYLSMVGSVTSADLREKLHAIEMVAFELGMRQSAVMREGREMDVMGEGGMQTLQRAWEEQQQHRQQQRTTMHQQQQQQPRVKLEEVELGVGDGGLFGQADGAVASTAPRSQEGPGG